jgi:hypothetical protein
MTAQVLAANLGGVALASDTLVTLRGAGGVRTFSGYSKIVPLGPNHKVAVMFSGNANINGFPCVTLLRNWASELTEPEVSVSDYAQSFLDWVDERQQSTGFLDELRLESQLLRNEFNDWLKIARTITEEQGDQASDYFVEYIDKLIEATEETGNYSGMTKEIAHGQIEEFHAGELLTFFLEFDEILPLSDELKSKILETCAFTLYKMSNFSAKENESTTFAFAGFGANQITPEVARFSTLGVFMGRMRTLGFRDSMDGSDTFSVGEDGMEDDFASFELKESEDSLLFSFAQDSTVKAFVGGISPELSGEVISRAVRDLVKDYLMELEIGISDSQALWESIRVGAKVDELINQLVEDKWEVFLGTISGLNLESLTSLSESLVRIQSLSKYTTETMSTVGDEIEVFYISKSEGVTRAS